MSSAMKVLVTGGTSGLGLAMASALAAAGATVALTGRSGARAAAVAAELPAAVGLELDVREEASVARAVHAAWSRLGGLDMLVNNAGIPLRTHTVVARCTRRDETTMAPAEPGGVEIARPAARQVRCPEVHPARPQEADPAVDPHWRAAGGHRADTSGPRRALPPRGRAPADRGRAPADRGRAHGGRDDAALRPGRRRDLYRRDPGLPARRGRRPRRDGAAPPLRWCAVRRGGLLRLRVAALQRTA